RIAELARPGEAAALFRQIDSDRSGAKTGEQRNEPAQEHGQQKAAARVLRSLAERREEARADDHRGSKEHRRGPAQGALERRFRFGSQSKPSLEKPSDKTWTACRLGKAQDHGIRGDELLALSGRSPRNRR